MPTSMSSGVGHDKGEHVVMLRVERESAKIVNNTKRRTDGQVVTIQ